MQILTQQAWSRAAESAFLASSQMLVVVQVHFVEKSFISGSQLSCTAQSLRGFSKSQCAPQTPQVADDLREPDVPAPLGEQWGAGAGMGASPERSGGGAEMGFPEHRGGCGDGGP